VRTLPATLPPWAKSRLSLTLTTTLTCLCPFNGRQDLATIRVDYVPEERLIEYESFEGFLGGYRTTSITHEAVTVLIAEVLWEALAPRSLHVATKWAPVEGVTVEVTIERRADQTNQDEAVGDLA
jgi:7-cyano-7-deazaguanine reductase